MAASRYPVPTVRELRASGALDHAVETQLVGGIEDIDGTAT